MPPRPMKRLIVKRPSRVLPIHASSLTASEYLTRYSSRMSDLWEDIPGSWRGVRAVAATRHAMFVLHEDGELYRIDPIRGEYTASLGRFASRHLVAHGDRSEEHTSELQSQSNL